MVKRFGMRPIVCWFAICILFVSSSFAQITTANMVGTVTDSSGAIVPGAKVTIENLGTHEIHSMQTGQSGDYTFNFLQPGSYSVTVRAIGFQAYKIPSLMLGAGDRSRADAKLEIGEASQTVQVTAAIAALQTDSSTVGSVVPERIVQDVPLNGRNYVTLVQNSVGVNSGPPNNGSSGTRPDDRRQTNEVSANGMADNLNNNMVDGMDNNERNKGLIIIRPAIDAIQEVRVDTNNTTAETGRAGGATINVITRAGTNSFHGTLYEFLRNDMLDANDYFAKQKNVPRYKYRQNQFGGSFGGPIRKDKTFFFADIEELRIVQGLPTGLITVPTLYEEQHLGDFSDQTVRDTTVPNPNNPGQFMPVGQPGPVVPMSQIDPVARKYWALFPAPLSSGTTNNYSNSPIKTFNSTTVDSRVDNHFSNGDSMFVRYSYNPVSSFTPGWLPVVNGVQPGGGSYPGPNKTSSQGAQLHYVHSFSSSLVAEAGMGFSRINLASLPLNYGNNVGESFGLPNSNINLNTSGLAPVVISGFSSGLGDSNFIPILFHF
jgi:hypothetical protein